MKNDRHLREKLSEIVGYTAPELLVEKLAVFVENQDLAAEWQPISSVLKSEKVLACVFDWDDEEYEVIEMIIVYPDGRVFNCNSGNYSTPVFTHWMPRPDPPEDGRGTVPVMRDKD